MQIIRYPSDVTTLHTLMQGAGDPPSLAIALGFFDGVHVGHRHLICEMIDAARERGLKTAIFTFESEAEGLKRGVTRLYPTAERINILASFGVDYLIVTDFSAVSGVPAEEFVREHLVGRLGCRLAAAGFNFRFGAKARGDAAMLSTLMSECGGEALILPEEKSHGVTVSTTAIRAALASGDCPTAAEMLGEPYHVSATVVHGRGDGSRFGFPTINTARDSGVPLPRGVYATAVKIGDKFYTGVTNLGVCPTFEEREEHFETMLLDFSEEVYGEAVRIYFLEYLRGEEVFPSPVELKKQIDRDAERARTIARSAKWQATGLN